MTMRYWGSYLYCKLWSILVSFSQNNKKVCIVLCTARVLMKEHSDPKKWHGLLLKRDTNVFNTDGYALSSNLSWVLTKKTRRPIEVTTLAWSFLDLISSSDSLALTSLSIQRLLHNQKRTFWYQVRYKTYI